MELSQDAQHSAQGFMAEEDDTQGSRQDEVHHEEMDKIKAQKQPQSRLKQIKLPKANIKGVWQKFVEDIDKVFKNELSGEVDRKLKAMSSVMYNIAAEWYRMVEMKGTKLQPINDNCRTQQIAKIR